MKLIIAGSRNFLDFAVMERCINEKLSGSLPDEVVSGCCDGGDTLGELWAFKNALPVRQFPALWNIDGRAAGAIRNRKMAQYGTQLIVFCSGESKGSNDMIRQAGKAGLPITIFITE